MFVERVPLRALHAGKVDQDHCLCSDDNDFDDDDDDANQCEGTVVALTFELVNVQLVCEVMFLHVLDELASGPFALHIQLALILQVIRAESSVLFQDLLQFVR